MRVTLTLTVLSVMGLALLYAEEATFSKINTAFGIELLQDENLWDDSDSDMASRLKWPEESKTATLSSYRNYAKDKERILGARPYSLVLYGEGGKPTELSMIFVNKGDFANFYQREDSIVMDRKARKEMLKAREEAVEGFEEAFKSDVTLIESNLVNVLGEPRKETFGQSQSTRERVMRWDWKGHAFLLAAPENEYIGLRILPAAMADADGKVERVKDSELRKTLSSRVERRPNGDVVVKEIPMVDQGPKGFCVPATWERYLRYMGIPADMYLLAMAGNTGLGGGTSTAQMASNIEDMVRRNGRKLDKVDGSFSPKNLSKYLDEGLPLMWGMCVDPFNKRDVAFRTEDRKKVTDWDEWTKGLEKYRKQAREMRKNLDSAHYCMVIGYNENTEEVAISDSWGADYAEQWMTFEEAEKLSLGELRIIRW